MPASVAPSARFGFGFGFGARPSHTHVGRHGSGGKSPSGYEYGGSAGAGMSCAWGLTALVTVVAAIVVVAVYAALVIARQSQFRAAMLEMLPQTAGYVSTNGPVQLLARDPAGVAGVTRFAASDWRSLTVASTLAVSDYSAAVRIVPVVAKADGVLSNGDTFKILFVRDGLWLKADGRLSPSAADATLVAVSGGTGPNGVALISDTLTLVGGQASTGGDDPVRRVLQQAGSGNSVLPFLNGTGC